MPRAIPTSASLTLHATAGRLEFHSEKIGTLYQVKWSFILKVKKLRCLHANESMQVSTEIELGRMVIEPSTKRKGSISKNKPTRINENKFLVPVDFKEITKS